MPRKPPSYERLTRPQRREKKPYESLPAIFDPDKQIMPDGNPRFAPRHKLNEKHNTRPAKRQRLRDQLAVAWGSKSGQRALELAAHAVGGDVQDIPEYARESLATLTAWVFTMRAVSGSVEHFREIGDRIDPKPKRIEIEGVNGARRGGGGADPETTAAAEDYYAALSGAVVIDASYTKEDEDDLSFLD